MAAGNSDPETASWGNVGLSDAPTLVIIRKRGVPWRTQELSGGGEAPRVAILNNPTVRGWLYQIILLVLVVYVGWSAIANMFAALRAQHIASGFGFLRNTAGFNISQSLIPYNEGQSTYLHGLFRRPAQYDPRFRRRRDLRHDPGIHRRRRPAVDQFHRPDRSGGLGRDLPQHPSPADHLHLVFRRPAAASGAARQRSRSKGSCCSTIAACSCRVRSPATCSG